MAKNSLEKVLEKCKKEVTKNVKKQIQADKRLADKQRREANRQVLIDPRREGSREAALLLCLIAPNKNKNIFHEKKLHKKYFVL